MQEHEEAKKTDEHIHEHVHGHEHSHEHGHSQSHAHQHPNAKAVSNRLARAIGHLESVKRMVDRGGRLFSDIDSACSSAFCHQQCRKSHIDGSSQSLHCGCGGRGRSGKNRRIQ